MIAPHARSSRARSAGKQIPKVGPSLEEAAVADPLPKPNSLATHGSAFVAAEQREAMIRNAAYLRAESRGFCPGHEVEDWLIAEAEVDRTLANGKMPTRSAD